jgi:predicted MFS family arabinose efflux permease
VGWVTFFLIGTDLFVISPLLPFIAETYAVSSATAGWMVTVFAVGYAGGAPFFGWFSDRRGRNSLITFGLLLFTVSDALSALAPTFGWLMVGRFLAGLSVASITPLIYAIIGDLAPAGRRGTWISIIVSGYMTSLLAGAPFGSMLEHYFGWRSVFVVLACLGAVLMVVNDLTWRTVASGAATSKRSEGHLPRILGSVSVTAIWSTAMYTLYVYLGAALYSVNGFTSFDIAIAVTLYGVGAVSGSLMGGRLSDRFGVVVLSKAALLLLSLILIGMGILFSSGYWIYALLLFWAMVGYSAFTSYQARLATEYPEERGTVMAWNMTALYVGITLSSMIGGYVITNWGYNLLPYVCSVAALISFALSMQKVQPSWSDTSSPADEGSH